MLYKIEKIKYILFLFGKQLKIIIIYQNFMHDNQYLPSKYLPNYTLE